ncbi:acyl-CoA N-acyltransferase [Catenaria anguillulae PL171]|uniref:Histone acetyltransferase type B catalytic subunit n=1 Tax=Catenaria anguillulae PL171 TaxID=765915 RepID=A0A1Y2HLK8_9FUNG|nr:acyl-CoA N-acyltransferase [Catenaria anguillulae PL171]
MVTIELVRSPAWTPALSSSNSKNKETDDEQLSHKFHPTFTYPFYGDDQEVIGYRDPKVTLMYSASSMSVMVSSTFKEKHPTDATVDLVQPLLEYLPQDLIHDQAKFAALLRTDASATTAPPGEKVLEYTLPGCGLDVFEVYSCRFSTPNFTRLYDRLKILTMFFIEAATPAETDDPHWDFLIVYRRPSSSSTGNGASGGGFAREFIAMVSLYSFFMYPEGVRRRLSQVLVLPPYQRKGHARRLYEYVLETCVRNAEVRQLTIEDPSEAMDVVRDLGDLHYLVRNNHGGVWALAAAGLATEEDDEEADPKTSASTPSRPGSSMSSSSSPATPGKVGRDPRVLCSHAAKVAALAQLTTKWKLHSRQAERLYEMLVLREMRARSNEGYRLMVKARIFRQNKDALMLLEDQRERTEKIHETYQAVLDEYRERLRGLVKILGR